MPGWKMEESKDSGLQCESRYYQHTQHTTQLGLQFTFYGWTVTLNYEI
jgi:hypothetical protein